MDTGRDAGGAITARDAYGFQLNYFTGDYLPINASRNPFPGHSAHIGAAYRPLYNGNISSMAVNIGKLNQPQLYNYEYDQLNRLVSMQAWRGFTSSTNSWTGMTATTDHQEAITYDANGNILTYLRNGNTSASKPLGMDNLSYFYNDSAGIRRNNKLRHVTDAVAAANYTEDIDGQAVDNYGYDAIGNLTRDNAEKISAITWNVYGKISQITKTASTVVGDLQLIRYGYDASGNRIRKTAYYNQDATNYRAAHTWYVRDASGNVMATYTSAGVMPKTSTRDTTSKVPLYLSELHMYGSTRLGIWSRNVNMDVLPTGGGTAALLGTAGIDTFNRGNKFFELANHLGNVLVTVSDRKIGQSPVNNLYTSFTADVVSATDYAPFGMQMVGRSFDAAGSTGYRYGFNGQEKTPEVSSSSFTAEYWQYDARIGRRWNIDPVYKHSPYESLGNNPIVFMDQAGLDTIKFNKHTTFVYPDKGAFSGGNQKPYAKTTFGIEVVKSDGPDIYLYTSSISILTPKEQTEINNRVVLNPNNPNSSSGVTKGKYLWLDGLITSSRDNKDWESIGKFMNLDKGFYDYMASRHPESVKWRARALSLEAMEGLMPVLVQSGLGSWIGFRYLSSGAAVAHSTTKGSNFYLKLFKPSNEFDVTTTLYRGLTGSEAGATQIFLTNDAAVAATYVKNGMQVMQYQVTRYSLKVLEQTGELLLKTGKHGSSGITSTEYMFQGKHLVDALNKIAKPN